MVTQIVFHIPIDFLLQLGITEMQVKCVRHYQCGAEEISVEALIEEQRRVSVSQNPFERVIGSLCVASMLKEQLVRLPNSTISQLMTDNIWCQLNLLGPESVIVEIASERLRESTIAIVPKSASVEKYESALVCPRCGAEL